MHFTFGRSFRCFISEIIQIQYCQWVLPPQDSIGKIFDIVYVPLRAYLIFAHIVRQIISALPQSPQLPVIPHPIGDYLFSCGKLALHILQILPDPILAGIHIRAQAIQALVFFKKFII